MKSRRLFAAGESLRPYRTMLLISFLTGVSPVGALGMTCHEAIRLPSLSEALEISNSSDFEVLFRRYFATPQRAENSQKFSETYWSLRPEEREDILASIQIHYVETTRRKNEEGGTNVALRRAMDAILNLETDRSSAKIQSVSYLEAAFLAMNHFLGTAQTIDFATLMRIAISFQGRLANTGEFLDFLKLQRANIERNQNNNPIFAGEAKALQQLIEEMQQGRGGIKVWILGSVANGRGIKGISDLDIYTSVSQINTSMKRYLIPDAGAFLKAFPVSEVSSMVAPPWEAQGAEDLNTRSRWTLEITSTQILFRKGDGNTLETRR